MSDMKTPKSPPWKFSVWRKDEQLAEFDVPAHKLEAHEVGRFLHALVVRSRTNSLEEMIKYYVNNRRGHPTRVPFAEVIRYSSDEFSENGFWCGEWECYARATQTVTEDVSSILRQIREKNIRAAQ